MTDINRRRHRHRHHHQSSARTYIGSSSSRIVYTFSTDTTITPTVDKFHEEVIRIVTELNISDDRFGDINASMYHDTIIPKFTGGMFYQNDFESEKEDPIHHCHSWEVTSSICWGIKGTQPSMQGKMTRTWRCTKCGVSRSWYIERYPDPVILLKWLLEHDFQHGGCCESSE